MSHLERHVIYIPAAKIKNEKVPKLEEDTVHCRLCPKGFVSVMALNNHAKIEHVDAYIAGDPTAWTAVKEEPEEAVDNVIKLENSNDEILFEMEPNISYVIVGTDDDKTKRKKQSKKSSTNEKVKKKKQVEPITGPFECLQPSATVPDGTCHQIFFSCCEYSIHHRDEHARRRKGFRCQVCEKPLACAGEELPFPCEICGEGFQTSDQLSGHTAINHVKLKPYECNICHKKFTQQGGVVQHMRMHTGDRPFPCTFCTKSFTQKSGLDQHLRTHTKVKPYCCIVCKKSFCQSIHLKQHMRTHTKVAPFQCSFCDKKFKQRSHLSFHLRSHLSTMSENEKTKYKDVIGKINTQNDISQGISVVDESQIEETQCSQNLAEVDLLTIQQDVQFESVVLEEPCYIVEEM